MHEILNGLDANAWNLKLERDTKAFDHDRDVWDTFQDQRKRHLLSGALTKQQVDNIFGRGRWRGIRRIGILQNGKLRGIDNARTSGINFAAWLQDAIMTTPHDISIQILCWLFNGRNAVERFEAKGDMWVGLSADDLADAYR